MKTNNEVLTALAMVQLSLEEFKDAAFKHDDLKDRLPSYEKTIDLLDECLEYLGEKLELEE